ncbi:MAG TPA: DNA cytosine methyltransferase [Oculatellaceae cyanobacterium]
MINPNKRPIGVDLFAGAGGMTLGFEQAGFDVLASVEIDPIHCATHKFNFPFWSVLCKDIAYIEGRDIRNISSIGNREIDVVFGGPPCQGFSLIGKRILDDPRNSLAFHFIRLIFELQPKYFVLENVRGMAVGHHKKFITEIFEEFQKIGYSTKSDYQILNAAEYGVPQNRERLFLIGCRQDMQLPTYPNKLTIPAKQRKFSSTNDLPLSPTVWDALKDLPSIESYIELLKRDWVLAEFGEPSEYGKKLRGLCAINNDYSYKRQYDSRILTSSLRTEHTLESIKRFESTLHGKAEPISRFHKLDPHGICNTLRAGTPSNRGAFTSPRPIHPFIPRCITVREAARLHSYPDWFRFHVTKWHGFRQIGNSVPPLLAKAVATEIIHALGITPIQPNNKQELGEEQLLKLNMSQACQKYSLDPNVIKPRIRKDRKQALHG